jgi:hypothetical protein
VQPKEAPQLFQSIQDESNITMESQTDIIELDEQTLRRYILKFSKTQQVEKFAKYMSLVPKRQIARSN